MASEAQRLIGISLTKIAQSRTHRGGVSLHKNLLVATVLQKARYIFMEEAYNMVHFHAPPSAPVPRSSQVTAAVPEENSRLAVGLTVEEAGLESTTVPEEVQESSSSAGDSGGAAFLQPTCVNCTENHHQQQQQQQQQDKENHPPSYGNNELTYLDLDKASPNVRRANVRRGASLKRRWALTEWETEEAVQSILPKKFKRDSSSSSGGDDYDDQEEEEDDDDSSGVTSDSSDSSSSSTSSSDDSVFLDDATLLSDIVSKEVEAERCQETTISSSNGGGGSAMEIDRITSLVSIFSFSMGGGGGGGGDGGSGKLNRSVSTPDLCSAQAKDSPDGIQQRPFLAMTV